MMPRGKALVARNEAKREPDLTAGVALTAQL
jgi:hypothetical protein